MNNKGKLAFDLEHPYTLPQLAEILGDSAKNIEEKYLKTGLLECFPTTHGYVVIGKWVVKFIVENAGRLGDDHMPTDGRGRNTNSLKNLKQNKENG